MPGSVAQIEKLANCAMLGQLRLLRRCQHVAQGFAQRGYASAQKQGRRQQEASPSPSDSSEKIEWWAVDGELFKAEKFDPKQVLAPLENEHISNKRRRRELARHLAKTRLKFKVHGQDSYWADYMRRFQILRDEWEKHVWDPPPTPRPKRRNPAWVAEETQKYVWQDPRREAVASRVSTHDTQRDAYTFDISSMDRSAIKSRFDEKIGYKGQSMGHSPYENRRSPGAPQSKSGVAALRQGNFGLGHRHLRRSEFEEFDEVFKRVRDTNQSSDTDAKASSTTENGDHSEAEIFNWDDTDSDVSEHAEHAKMSSLDGDTDSDDGEFQKEDLEKKRKGWFGPEDDLFKDD